MSSEYIPEFWGLDIETSGSDVNQHALIQIGLAAPNSPHTMTMYLKGWRWVKGTPLLEAGYAKWEQEAFEVHGIPQIALEAPEWDPAYTDDGMSKFLESHTERTARRERIVVGWNVAGFDMPFVRRDLPGLASLLSYRTYDLNTAVFTLMPEYPSLTYTQLKSIIKNEAARRVGGEAQWHNAGFDAHAGLKAKEVIHDIVASQGWLEALMDEWDATEA
jgi:hypothetical protein